MGMMKPIATTKVEESSEWLYEVKYDGLRLTLLWTENDIKLMSKNHIDLSENFPEVIHYCRQIQSSLSEYFPIQLDGELVILNNRYQANFAMIQKRGRLKSTATIEKYASERPATFIIFDILEFNGKSVREKNLLKEKRF